MLIIFKNNNSLNMSHCWDKTPSHKYTFFVVSMDMQADASDSYIKAYYI